MNSSKVYCEQLVQDGKFSEHVLILGLRSKNILFKQEYTYSTLPLTTNKQIKNTRVIPEVAEESKEFKNVMCIYNCNALFLYALFSSCSMHCQSTTILLQNVAANQINQLHLQLTKDFHVLHMYRYKKYRKKYELHFGLLRNFLLFLQHTAFLLVLESFQSLKIFELKMRMSYKSQLQKFNCKLPITLQKVKSYSL